MITCRNQLNTCEFQDFSSPDYMGWQMIKITINSAVYEALQKAFPKPANSAHRALGKYIGVLETMLVELHPNLTQDLHRILTHPI